MNDTPTRPQQSEQHVVKPDVHSLIATKEAVGVREQVSGHTR